ncbi:MAG TPA: hypothetical protein VGH87_12280 [Polyangiaceae bacterium]
MKDVPLGVLLGVGIPLFVALLMGTIFYFVFSAIRKATARTRAELEREGIVLDTGPTWITIRLSNFRGQGRAVGTGYEKTRASLILSKERLVVVPSRWRFFRVNRADLGRYTVGTDGAALVIHTDDPPNATGTIEYRVTPADAQAWVKALVDAGARAR